MSKGKILIVDDEPDVITYLTAVLENSGYKAFSADNADEGFEMLRIIEPDAICLDIMMPKELGLNMYSRLKKDEIFKNTPVIIISGVVSEENFEFRKLVPDNSIPPPHEYLEKPINRAQFLQIIDKLLTAKKKMDC